MTMGRDLACLTSVTLQISTIASCAVNKPKVTLRKSLSNLYLGELSQRNAQNSDDLVVPPSRIGKWSLSVRSVADTELWPQRTPTNNPVDCTRDFGVRNGAVHFPASQLCVSAAVLLLDATQVEEDDLTWWAGGSRNTSSSLLSERRELLTSSSTSGGPGKIGGAVQNHFLSRPSFSRFVYE